MSNHKRIIGSRKQFTPSNDFRPSSFNGWCEKWSGVQLYMPRGIYRYKSHADANKDMESWLGKTIYANMHGVDLGGENHSRPASWQDVLNTVELLNRYGVEYILVGGYAQQFVGYVRQTMDIDLAVHSSEENAQKWIKALSYFSDAFADQMSNEENIFQDNHIKIIRVNDEFLIDIMGSVSGIPYKELSSYVIHKEINGINVRTLSIEGLVKTKESSLRGQDKHDAQISRRVIMAD